MKNTINNQVEEVKEGQVTHKIKPELKENLELFKSYEEAVKIHQDYTDQISYIGSLVTENDEEVAEQGEMIMTIMMKRYEVALFIIKNFYDEVDEAGNVIDSEGFIVLQD